MPDTLDTAGAVSAYLNNETTPAQLGAQARYNMVNVVGGKPDYEAELRSVAQRTGVPVDTVRAYPDEMKKQATLGAYDFDQMAVEFPNTTKFLADQDKAAVGHADIGTLKTIEQAMGSMLKYTMGNGSSTIGGDVAAAYHAASGGAAGAFGAVARTAGAPLSFLEDFQGIGGNPLFRLSEGFMRIADSEADAQKAAAGKSNTWLGGAFSSGVQSLVQNAPGMLLALVPGGQGAALAAMGVTTGGQSYQKDMVVDRGHWPSLIHGISDATIEVGTEMGPLHGLVDNIKAGTPLFTTVLKNAWQENKGEQVATALQDLNDWAINDVNKGKTFFDYLKERPEAAAQTAIATLVGAGGNVAIMHGVQTAVDQAQGRNRQLEYLSRQAEQHAQALEAVQTTMQASEMLKHSPETLTAYMQDLADQGASNVYVDSAKLVDAGVDLRALAQAVPSIASQFDQVQSGGDLVIPTSELLTGTVGTEFAQPLIDNARTDVNGMSRAEAKVYMQEQGDKISAEIERVMVEKENDAEFKAGRDQVQAQIVAQLNEVKRFTSKVNEHYATLAANFYAVMAARTGMTVQQFADTYKLGFSGQSTAGGANTLNQVLPEAMPPGMKQGDAETLSAMYRKADATRAVLLSQADGRLVTEGAKLGAHLGSFSHSVDQSALNHIQSLHGTEATELARGQLPVRDTDIAQIPEIVKNYDSVRFDLVSKLGRPMVAYAKNTPDGALLYFEEAHNKRHDLAALSMRRYPATSDAKDILRNVTLYVQNDSEHKPIIGKPPVGFNQDARGQISFADDITQQASIISMMKGADLSTFIHEGGHFFLEVQADLAAKIATRIAADETVSDGERAIADDFNTTLAWMGVEGSPELSAIDTWYLMTPDEKRPHHEQWARGFEAYAFEGKSPSMELAKMFQTFRAWLVNVYRAMLKSVNASKADIADTMKVELSDEVRAVMDRMLATSDQIAEAEAARNMGPLFKTPEEAGMDLDAYKLYHDMGAQATMDAVDELQGKGLRDMQWLSNARSRKLKELQKQHDALRAQIAREVRAEVLSQPIYRAWTFLTAKGGDKVEGNKPVGRSTGVNPEVDNLFEAIAKLGGLDRAAVKSQWGLDEKEKFDSGVFGMPVVRKTGGVSLDTMGQRLIEEGYLLPDEHGNYYPEKLEELFDDQRRGTDRYSIKRDMAAAYGDAPVNLPDMPDVSSGKLRTEDLRYMYGVKDDAVWRKLSELRMTSDATGLHPDVVGELFGFTSGDELVRALAAAEPPKSVIEGKTDQRMLEEHGDLATPAGIERAADMAIHNDARVRFVATELRALQHAMSVREKVPGKKHTVDVLVQMAKEQAGKVIARLKVRDIRPAQYAAAEVRSAKAALAARGDLAKQAEHKRNQLINLYAAKAAYAAQEEIKKAITYFKKFDSTSSTLDPEYQQQIEQLLESVDLRKISLKAIDKRKTLAEWAQKQDEMGLPADIPESLLLEANRKSIKDMTVEEVRGLRETIQQIEHLGRLKHKLLTAKDQREFALIVAEAGESIRANGGPERATQLEEPAGVMPWLQGLAAGHRKLASLLRQMDGGKDAGPLWRILGRTMNDAGTQEVVMIEDATIRLTKLYEPLLKLKGGINGDLRFIPEIKNSLTRGGRLAVALNWGNETNRSRVMLGDNWTGEQVGAIFKHLTREEWQFVQDTWAFIDSYWPQIEAKQLRVTGVAPEKVAASPFQITLANGETMNLTGGYYPVKYDANRDDRAEKHDAAAVAKDMMGGAFTRATTRRGHTKARVEEVRRPVKKTLDVITQHVSQVTHDLAWHEWLIDANRLIDAKPINQAIRERYGTPVLRTMKDALMAIATADVVPQTKIDQALLHLRANISRSTMGFSLTTALMQPFGLTQSMVRIGPKHVLQGLKRWGGDAVRFESSLGWIQDKSDFMRMRSKTFNRELHEIRGRVSHGHSKARQVYDASLFMLMGKMQLVADIPTWIGGYEKALAQGRDEATAVALADQGVLDAQGSGQTKDMAELQRKHPMLGMFYSYFNVTYNLAAESTAKTDFKNPLALAGWVSDMALLMVIPALAPAILIEMLRGGGDDDAEKWGKKLLEWQASYLLGTVMGLRETSGVVSGFDYSGPPVGRVIADLGKLGKQVAQGEVDEGLALAGVRLLGSVRGIPTVQLIRSWRGWRAWEDGNAPVTSVLLGPPSKD